MAQSSSDDEQITRILRQHEQSLQQNPRNRQQATAMHRHLLQNPPRIVGRQARPQHVRPLVPMQHVSSPPFMAPPHYVLTGGATADGRPFVPPPHYALGGGGASAVGPPFVAPVDARTLARHYYYSATRRGGAQVARAPDMVTPPAPMSPLALPSPLVARPPRRQQRAAAAPLQRGGAGAQEVSSQQQRQRTTKKARTK